MSKFVNQIYSPHSLTTFSFGVSSLHLIFPFSVTTLPCWCELVARTLRWARTHFAKDNFPLCYAPTFPSLFPSLIPPSEGG